MKKLELLSNGAFLYRNIRPLCKAKGYCWAGNAFLAKARKVSERSIQRYLKELVSKGYILVEYAYIPGKKEIASRHIRLSSEAAAPAHTVLFAVLPGRGRFRGGVPLVQSPPEFSLPPDKS
jgi:hypothetical protein